MIKYLLFGFFTKVVTGFDDTITHIPILASITKKKLGRVAFSIGIFTAIIVGIIGAIFFAEGIKKIPYYRFVSAGLIFILAVLIYFNVLVHTPRTKAEKKIQSISAERFTTLIGLGFVAGIATVLDDIIAFAPLFLRSSGYRIAAVTGILLAVFVDILILIYASEKIAKIKHKEKIASAGLVILGVLTITGII